MNKIQLRPKTIYMENDQESTIRFSPCVEIKGRYVELWSGVSCRDKMQELPMLLANPSRLPKLHGFSFDSPTLIQHQGERLLLLISFYKEGEREVFKSNLHKLDKLESELSLDRVTIVTEEEFPWNYGDYSGKYCILLSLDLWWVRSPLILSVLTFFLRTLSYSFFSDISDIDDLAEAVRKKWVDNEKNDGYLRGYEQTLTRSLSIPECKLSLILKNADKILGDSPLTGNSDELIIPRYRAHDHLSTGEYIFDDPVILSSKHFKNYTKITTYCHETQHCCLGFTSFFDMVKSCINHGKDRSIGGFLYNSPRWILNYMDMLVDEGLINKNEYAFDLKPNGLLKQA